MSQGLHAPRASVVVTCFNLGSCLREALDSLHAQTYLDFETVIVDDGSTHPGTIRLLDSIERDVRVIRTPNRGLPAARNTGIRHTTGEYICCLDADDLLAPTYLARSVALLDAQPGLAFASHWLEAFGDEHWSWQPSRCDLEALLDANTVNGAALFRRCLWHAIHGFDESMTEGCEDWEFWLRAIIKGHRGAIIPEVLHRYRRRSESMSRTMDRHRLYGELARRHPYAFREHLPGLLQRREQTIATLQHSIDAMELELSDALLPALESRQREVAAAQQLLTEVRRQQANESVRATLAWEAEEQRRRADWLWAEREELLRRLSDAEATARGAQRAAAQLAALRGSWSWRLTSPLRWLAGFLPPPDQPSSAS